MQIRNPTSNLQGMTIIENTYVKLIEEMDFEEIKTETIKQVGFLLIIADTSTVGLRLQNKCNFLVSKLTAKSRSVIIRYTLAISCLLIQPSGLIFLLHFFMNLPIKWLSMIRHDWNRLYL